MDDKKLKKILDDAEIQPDPNAKKRAVNIAVSEFKAHQQKKGKKFQGIGFFARLMGNDNSKDGRTPMERKSKNKLIYGGMATAMALVLVVSTSSYIFTQSTRSGGGSTAVSELKKVQFRTVGDSNIASNEARVNAPKPSLERGRRELAEADMAYEAEEAMSMAQSLAAAPAVTTPPVMAKRMTAEGFAGNIVRPAPMPVDDIAPNYYKDEGRDKFEDFKENPIKVVAEEPVSTFSSDVDTASYSFVRRQLNNGVMPQKDAVRIEELINYFDYNYPLPESREQPFKPTVTLTDSPWTEGKKLMHIGIKGFDIEGQAPKSNLVFLLDTSGSMNSPDKLPLVKNSLKLMLDNMNADDTISIVVYAGSAGTVLEPTPASEKGKIIAALDRLSAGGSTAGAAGINLAYQLAEQKFDKDAVNRVILATDGDFNVGITNREELKDFVERKREKGIFLSVLGFGQGNYNDHMMQTLAQNGNGVAAYIDNLNEARKVLVEEASSTLFPIAKDVKVQVEFNPAAVAEYRLIGYETRALNREDFNNDKVDAGDIGAGHTVTAIYEITPVGSKAVSVDPLRYGAAEAEKATADTVAPSHEYAFVKLRYKLPDENTSKLITTPVTDANADTISNDTKFATAVAAFGQILKGGQYTGNLSYDDVIALAQQGKGQDEFGYRSEFIQMVRLAKSASTLPQ